MPKADKEVCHKHGILDQVIIHEHTVATWDKTEEVYEKEYGSGGHEWSYLCPKCLEEGKKLEDCVLDGGRD